MTNSNRTAVKARIGEVLSRSRSTISVISAALFAIITLTEPVYANGNVDIGDIITNVIEFLSWGVGVIGALIVIFGMVTLGKGISSDSASDQRKGILGIVGGLIIVAVGILIGTAGPTWIVPPSF